MVATVQKNTFNGKFFRIGWLCLLLVLFCSALGAAAGAEKYELGIQLTGMHLHKIDEVPFGIGVRFHYNLLPLLASDVELSHYPQNSSGNFGETTALFGVRFGTHLDRLGVFGKARSGWIHFGGGYFDLRLDRKTHAILDTGGMVEYYPSAHTFLRIDASDVVIYYGSARLFNRPNPDPLGTVHNFQPGFGFGFRF